MASQIGKSCFDQDKVSIAPREEPHFDSMTDKWHPGLRASFIVVSAASLWALLLAFVF